MMKHRKEGWTEGGREQRGKLLPAFSVLLWLRG